MTAFARVQTEADSKQLVWELRSVNHRFLEVQFRMPDSLRMIEHSLRETTRKYLKRGKLDGSLRVDTLAAEGSQKIQRPALLQLLASLEQVRRDAPESQPPSSLDLLRWPGILSSQTSADDAATVAAATDLFEQALSDLIAQRRREGGALAQVIVERLDDIDRLISELRTLTATVADELANRLRQRLADAAASVDPERLESEIVLLAQKADIAEELDRLTIHVEGARSHLYQHGPHGRRLDFLTQELNREANTIGSKSALVQCSQKAVDLKVIIEQIREQVQNIE